MSTSFSANCSGQKYSTCFSHTYNLLSQYLKQKNKWSAAHGVNVNQRACRGPTMDLFPQKAAGLFGSASSEATSKASSSSSAQMTIFYNGHVIVIDDLCSSKADEILQLAASTDCISKADEILQNEADTRKNNGNIIKDSDHDHDRQSRSVQLDVMVLKSMNQK